MHKPQIILNCQSASNTACCGMPGSGVPGQKPRTGSSKELQTGRAYGT